MELTKVIGNTWDGQLKLTNTDLVPDPYDSDQEKTGTDMCDLKSFVFPLEIVRHNFVSLF